MTILSWTIEEKLNLAARQIALLREVEADPLLGATAEFMPELTMRHEQAPYLYYEDLWNTWLFSGGRGSGKTRAGVSWCLYEIEHTPFPIVISVVSPTQSDIVRVIMEGDSGFLRNTPQWMGMTWRKSDNVLLFKNGSFVRTFSAEAPERMRGLNSHKCWADEIAGWPPNKVRETMHQITLSNRLTGTRNQLVITTTPRVTIPYLRQLMKKDVYKANVIQTTGSTYDNAINLGEAFRENIKEIEKSGKGREEILGLLGEEEGAQNFEEDDFQIWPAGKRLPKIHKVVVGIDGAFTDNTKNDPTGCVVFGVFYDSTINDWSVLLLDVWEKWLNFNDLSKECQKMWDLEYGADLGPGKYPDIFAIEWAASGIPLIQQLIQYKNKRGENVNVTKRMATGEKYPRICSVCPLVKSGRVYVMGGERTTFASWVEPLINQLVEIPNAERDDMADAFAHALLYLQEINWVNMPFPDRLPPNPEYDVAYSSSPQINPYGV